MTPETLGQQVDAAISALQAQINTLTAQVFSLTTPSTLVKFQLSDFVVQAADPSRVSVIITDRGPAIRLQTLPGDSNIAGSDTMERCDLYLGSPGGAPTLYGEGVEQWWYHSIMLPNDFSYPTWQMYVVLDFHNQGGGQANLHLNFAPQPVSTDVPGNLIFRGYGGVQDQLWPEGITVIGQIPKNAWQDFIFHVRWASDGSGFCDAWWNGKRMLSHQGPTLYQGQGVYLKLANYHAPSMGPSAVIHGFPVKADNVTDLGFKPLDVNWQTLIRI